MKVIHTVSEEAYSAQFEENISFMANSAHPDLFDRLTPEGFRAYLEGALESNNDNT